MLIYLHKWASVNAGQKSKGKGRPASIHYDILEEWGYACDPCLRNSEEDEMRDYLSAGDLYCAKRTGYRRFVEGGAREMRTQEETGWKQNVVSDACNPTLRWLRQEDCCEFKASLD